MLNRYTALTIMALMLGGAGTAVGQKATEMYIPIGQSPGVSSKSCVLGTIQAVDAKKRTLTVLFSKRTWTVKIPSRTPIWIDRSPDKQPNRYGTLADLKPGRKVEVRLGEKASDATARWVKVRL